MDDKFEEKQKQELEQGCRLESNWSGEPDFGRELTKKRDFKKGMVAGIVSTLMVVTVIAAAAIAVTISLRHHVGKKTSQAENKKSESGEGEAIEIENLLNADFISQVSMISAYLSQYYLYDIEPEKIRDGMLEGLAQAIGDPYADYYNEGELRSFQDSTQGEYVGIGAAVTQELSTGIVRISKPYEGTPSVEAGLLPGDMLVSVEDTAVTGMDLEQVVSLIKGEEGTSVMLHIYRESEEAYLDVEVERRQVEIPTVVSEMLPDNIGYIEVIGFDGVTTNQFISAYEELKDQGMERVIVDLRNNGGGLVDTVEGMLDYLLPEGEIFYVKYKDGSKGEEYISDAEAALDIPMVVLVNEYTASASEIFAGNIQAFGLGEVVGTTTFGKGVMQQLYYTNEERTAALKITVADYYINGDKNINDVGITPDVEVELNEEAAQLPEIPLEQDNQLQVAIETVKAQ